MSSYLYSEHFPGPHLEAGKTYVTNKGVEIVMEKDYRSPTGYGSEYGRYFLYGSVYATMGGQIRTTFWVEGRYAGKFTSLTYETKYGHIILKPARPIYKQTQLSLF